jgi:hypothetical protein
MRSPATAIAWQLWNRHRLGLSISALCLLLMVPIYPPLLRAFPTLHVLVITLIAPVVIFAYVANLLIFTDEIGSLSSGYPRRMFTLPVATGTLVFWPMLIGATVVVSLWLIVSLLIYARGGYRPALVLPAMALAIAAAWNQVVAWSPIKSYLVRVYGAILGYWLLIGWPCSMHLNDQISHSSLLVLGLFEVLLLFAAAWFAVREDRRGDDWSLGLERAVDRFWSAVEHAFQPRGDFRSSAASQLWYESCCHGMLLVGTIYALLFPVAGMYLRVPQDKTLAFRIALGSIVAMPFMMAGSQGVTLGRMRPPWSKQRGLITFQAVRPITTGAMLEAKYRLAARSAVHVWVLTLAVSATLVLIKGQAADVGEILRSFLRLYPGWRGITSLGLAVVLAPVYIWKLYTDSLVPVLTGRRWLADGAVLLSVILLMSLICVGVWLPLHPAYIPRIVPILIWLAAVFVLVKFIVSYFAFRVALGQGLLELRSLLWLFAAWALVAVLTLTLVLLVIPPASRQIPFPVMLVASLSLLPLARFALAPLALDWNRRR